MRCFDEAHIRRVSVVDSLHEFLRGRFDGIALAGEINVFRAVIQENNLFSGFADGNDPVFLPNKFEARNTFGLNLCICDVCHDGRFVAVEKIDATSV